MRFARSWRRTSTSSVAERSAGDRVEQFLDAAARWEAFPDVAHRCVLLAFDAAMLSGDRSLVARCQAVHERIQELTGEPPTWRLPMVEGLRNLAEGRLDERPADLRLFGARNRSEVVDTLIGAFATRYVDGPVCRGSPCSTATLRSWVSTVIERRASTAHSVG